MTHRHPGWTSRGYLPHFDQPFLIQGITFRLADALPTHVVAAMINDPDIKTDEQHRAHAQAYLDAGHGGCYLNDARIGTLVEDALHYFDGQRYALLAWVVMPNHVHTLVETREGFPLKRIVHPWKSYTAKAVNALLGRSGPFWYPAYFDRFVRDERHYLASIAYIHDNPVKAGLVEKPEDWRFSSVRQWAAR
ncbi:MAG: transposase [Anaerolineae bacterium]|nr:transposase [Anaerolineae bacterium]